MSVYNRKALLAANLGRKLSPDHCAKLSATHMGKQSALGHKQTPEHRARLSAARKGNPKISGPNHPAWLGGISRLPYAWTFNAELKEEVRRRDGYKCQKCGVPQAECKTKLPVHHVDYDKKNSDPVNLVALCVSCNTKVNANRAHWTAFFQATMLRKAITDASFQ